jgi:hypothetical protein
VRSGSSEGAYASIAYFRPAVFIVTTPSTEFNAFFAGEAVPTLRHPDHRFEWTRDQFRS